MKISKNTALVVFLLVGLVNLSESAFQLENPEKEEGSSFAKVLNNKLNNDQEKNAFFRLATGSTEQKTKELFRVMLETGILDIFSNNRVSIFSDFTEISDENDRIDILKFLSELGFISRDISFSDFRAVFQQFSGLSKVGREGRLESILNSNMLSPEMRPGERIKIIHQLNRSLLGDEWSNGQNFNRALLMAASEFITPEMIADDRCSVISTLGSFSSCEVPRALSSGALQLCTTTMTPHDRLGILNALAQGLNFMGDSSVIEYRLAFSRAWLEEASLQGLVNPDNIFALTHQFLIQAERFGPQPRYGSDENGNRYIRGFSNGEPINVVRGAPIVLGAQANGAALPAARIDMVSQEAISAQRRAIKETYEALATSAETAPVIHKYLPSDGTENGLVVVQVTKLIHLLEVLLQTEKLSPVEQMKTINALLSMGILTDQPDIETLSRIRSLSPKVREVLNRLTGSDTCTFIPRHGISNISSYRHYSHPNLPNIRQFFALVFNLLDQQMGASSDQKVFTKNWLGETFANNPKAWDVFKKAFEHDFPGIKLPGTIGEALEHQPFLETHFASCLEQTLKGEGVSDSVSHKDHHKAIRNLVMSYVGAFKERHTALIEALSMIMRGHNENLDSLEETNRPACAEGAYLGLIKVLQEIPDVNQIIGASLAEIDVVTCAVAGPAATAPSVSVVSLDEVPESSDQTRTLREEQDAAYAASLAADQERDRLRALEQQRIAATERVEAAASAESEETAAERRARIAAAAEARRAGQN